MLAPLKDRSIIEREGAAEDLAGIGLQAENTALRQALRQVRRTQKRTATLSAREIVALTNDKHRLEALNRQLKMRLDELESGQAVVELGQQLLALRQENDELAEAAQRLWFLDRTLCAAQRECERLARERDSALHCLQARSERLIS